MSVTGRFRARLAALAFMVSCAPAASAHAADVRSWDHGDYGRLVFEWDEPVSYRVDATAFRITIDFDHPVAVPLAEAVGRLGVYLEDAAIGGDGSDVVLVPRHPLSVEHFALDGDRVVFDFRIASDAL